MVSPDMTSEQSDPGTEALAHAAGLTVTIAILLSLWGQWRAFFEMLLVSGSVAVGNVALASRLPRRISRTITERARVLLNAVGFMLTGHIAAWMPLVWFYVPFNLLWFSGADRWVRVRLAAFLLAVSLFALWDGANPQVVLVFSLVGIFGYLLMERRVSLLRQVLLQLIAQREELRQAHQHLQQVHQRALAQEKLSSLGMMAAGVAHEINNPMSFITSNINSLYKDLQRLPHLPEPLKEYVDEVLPATLDGIKRVNSIVGDLRRFARGDAETYVPYELTTEVQAALRIAHNQLDHCQMETDLGEVGTVMGRPQQIVQVLVNLLVNAGQATPADGRVRVSTRSEGEWVRVEIRDTGTGISPEAMRHLFQPFFTTKPPGVGMGLGLAVAHGIVTAHGGRIEVENEPGKGACFTLHLPRVPGHSTSSSPSGGAAIQDSRTQAT